MESMKITILTLFPKMFTGPFDYSILKRAQEKNLVEIDIVTIRDFGIGKHKLVDDTPYGGGLGMVMRVDVLHKAVQSVQNSLQGKEKIALLSASGKKFTQKIAKEYATLSHLVLICGHYEGVDERIHSFIDEEISVGDFVTTGGEIPAMLVVDAVTRLVPDVLKKGVADDESFSLRSKDGSLLEYPHYTNPRSYRGKDVPEILLSGDHKKIQSWRLHEALTKTRKRRPDLLQNNDNK